MQIGLRLRLNAAGQLVEHFGRLVDPVALLSSGRKHLMQSRPEAQGTISHSQFRIDRQAPMLEVRNARVRTQRLSFAGDRLGRPPSLQIEHLPRTNKLHASQPSRVTTSPSETPLIAL